MNLNRVAFIDDAANVILRPGLCLGEIRQRRGPLKGIGAQRLDLMKKGGVGRSRTHDEPAGFGGEVTKNDLGCLRQIIFRKTFEPMVKPRSKLFLLPDLRAHTRAVQPGPSGNPVSRRRKLCVPPEPLGEMRRVPETRFVSDRLHGDCGASE